RVTAGAVLVTRGQRVEQLADQLTIVVQPAGSNATRMYRAVRVFMRQTTLGGRDQLFDVAAHEISLGARRLDPLLLQERRRQRKTQSLALLGISIERFAFNVVSHRTKSLFALVAASSRDFGILRQIALFLQLADQFVERLFTKVTDSEHGIRTTVEHLQHIANGGNAGALEGVKYANAEVEFLDGLLIQLSVLALLKLFLLILACAKLGIAWEVDAADHSQVLHQNLRRLAQRLFGANCAIGPDFEDQLVVIGTLADTRPVDIEVDAANGAENRVDRQLANRQATALFGRAVTTPGLDRELHLDMRVWRVGGEQIKVRVDDLDLRRADDVGGRHQALTTMLKPQPRGLDVIQLQAQLLDLKDQLRHVLADVRNGGKLVMHVRDTDARNRRTRQR